MTIKNNLLIVFMMLFRTISSGAQPSSWVYYDTNMQLVYLSDAKGNKIPDFSHVGYKNGEIPLPVFPIVKTITPVNGDNLQNIQSAIDEVAAMAPDANGIRGALLIKAGSYPVNGRITVSKGGIALIGEGCDEDGTVIHAKLKEQHDFIHFKGSAGASADVGSLKKILTPYLPIGGKTFVVESGHTFMPGNNVYFERRPNQKWIELLEMHTLSQTDPEDVDWTPEAYIIRYKRKVVNVKGDTLTLDAPIVDVVDPAYAEGYLRKYNWSGKIFNVGTENIRLVSDYTSDSDENHGWNAIKFDNVEDGWVRNIEAWHFGYSAVNIGSGSSQISVLDSKCLDPISQTTGGRKYSFNVDGQRILVKNCFARAGRHDYVNGSRTAGPNVFVQCKAADQKSDIGPHHRWATGILFDNIVGNGEMNVQNRRNSGTGHGWAGAQTMFWNCTAKTMIVQDPPGDHMNWAIGNKASVTGKTYPIGVVESTGTHVIPESLYEAQLAERLGYDKTPPEAPGNLEAEVTSKSRVRLSWTDRSQNESSYFIEVSVDQGKTWTSLGVVSQNVTSYLANDLSEIEHLFRVRAKNAFGFSGYSNSVALIPTPVVQIVDTEPIEKLLGFTVYPNPGGGAFHMVFEIKERGNVSLVIYDMSGREVEVLENGCMEIGCFRRSFTLPNATGAGIYYVRLTVGNQSVSKRLIMH